MTSVNIVPIEWPDELFKHYSGQNSPQPVVLSLNLEDGELTCRYNPEIGNARPESVHHNRIIWLDMPCLTAEAANQLLTDATEPAQRILDGAEIVWNGHNNVGQLDDDAQAALDELANLCDPAGFDASLTVEGMDASDWFSDVDTSEVIAQFGITADTADDVIEAMAREAEEDAHTVGNAGYTVLTGAEEYLTGLRDDLRDDLREQLAATAEKIARLEDRRIDLIRQVRAWGAERDSLRALANLAGMSHMEVKRIVDAGEPSGTLKIQVATILGDADTDGATPEEIVARLRQRWDVETNVIQVIAALRSLGYVPTATGQETLTEPYGRYYSQPTTQDDK